MVIGLLDLFGITSNTLVRSGQSASGPAGAHPTAVGWDEELLAGTASVRLPPPGRSESSFRTDPGLSSHMTCHAQPPVLIGIGVTGGPESVLDG